MLYDFGSAKMGFSSIVQPSSLAIKKQPMMGSPGYTDPHYIRTGIASKKNDVYSFDVLLLELVMGMEAFTSEKGQLLTSMVGPKLVDGCVTGEEEVARMVYSRLAASDEVQNSGMQRRQELEIIERRGKEEEDGEGRKQMKQYRWPARLR